MPLKMMEKMKKPADSTIVMLVLDGLGGLPAGERELTALERAQIPHMDRLARKSACGLHLPVQSGVTPGSGPAHLALFGYDPLQYQTGRGTLAALGVNFDLWPGDVAARGNFCTVDADGVVTDRRAGRIRTSKNEELCRRLQQIQLTDVDVFVRPVKDYRFLLVLRNKNLSSALADTDPQQAGQPPLAPRALLKKAEPTAALLQTFLEKARQQLAEQHPANMILMRGFSNRPQWPSMKDVYGLRCAAIAAYPMYRGLAQLMGMENIEVGDSLDESLDALEAHWRDYDFFYVHFKQTDSAGEDGDFARKVALLEAVDAVVPRLMKLAPEVLIITGDHSTPAVLKAHSWHPVPVLLYSNCCRPDDVAHFGERACVQGALGPRLPALDLMPLAMANAGRLRKFGA